MPSSNDSDRCDFDYRELIRCFEPFIVVTAVEVTGHAS